VVQVLSRRCNSRSRGKVSRWLRPHGRVLRANNFSLVFTSHFVLAAGMMSNDHIAAPAGQLTGVLKPDSTQEAAVKELMVGRGTELLTLIDKSPPTNSPSTLSFC
jgi:hypothetical protein